MNQSIISSSISYIDIEYLNDMYATLVIRYHDGNDVKVLGQYQGKTRQDDLDLNRTVILRYESHLRQLQLFARGNNGSKDIVLSSINDFNLHSLLHSSMYE